MGRRRGIEVGSEFVKIEPLCFWTRGETGDLEFRSLRSPRFFTGYRFSGS